MKIKPIIKTHWVASQNPMMVSLGGLRKLIFRPSLESMEFSFGRSKDEGQKLESAHVKNWSLVPLRDFGSAIEFIMEDGEAFSLQAVSVDTDLPHFLNPHYYLKDRSCNWNRVIEVGLHDCMKPLKIFEHQKRHVDWKKSWFTVLEILAWALQRKRQVGDLDVLLVPPGQSPENEMAYPLTEIEFLPSRQLMAQVEKSAADSLQVEILQSLESEKDHGVLKLYSSALIMEVERLFANARIHAKNEQKGKWESRFVGEIPAQKSLLDLFTSLEDLLGIENLNFVDKESFGEADFKPRLKVREFDGSLQVGLSFLLEKIGLEHHQFPPTLAKAFLPFEGGIDVVMGLDRKVYASGKPHYRNNDLLLLRHQGLALFCLLELTNWLLGKPLSSGEKIQFVEDLESAEADQQFEKILEYLKFSVPGILGRNGSSFEMLFSDPVKTIFIDYIEKIFRALAHDRSFLMAEGRLLEIKKVYPKVLLILRFLLLYFIEASRGKFLTKASAPVGERFKASLALWTEPKLMDAKKALESFQIFWVDIGHYHKIIIPLLFDLLDNGVEIEFNGQPFLSQSNPFEFILEVGTDTGDQDHNWFDLHPQIFFNGKKVESDEVQINFWEGQQGFIEYRGQIYRIDKKELPSLKSLQKFWNKLKGQKNSRKHQKFGDKIYKLDRSYALELLMLKTQGVNVRAEGEWAQIFDYFEQGLGADKIELPEEVEKKLLTYQKEGAQWLHDLYQLRLGAILADEMGLGKTFQVLSFLTSLQQRNKLEKSLVVVPTSLVYNWIDEKKKFANNLPVEIFQSSESIKWKNRLAKDEPLVLIVTYGLLVENQDFFESIDWNTVVFDEAQNLKNITSMRSVAARKLKANYKVCLTGTPMENNYLEFFSLCDLVVPGSLGDIDSFRREFVNKEVRVDSLKELRLISKPLVLRRTKQQVKLSLPVKTVQNILLPFNPEQREIYKKMAMRYSRQVEELIQEQGESRAQIAMFAALMRLRQICSDPAALPGLNYTEKPVKVEHFLSSLQDHLENQESVVVFTQFLSTLGRIENELKKAKIPCFTLQGRIRAKDRLNLISSFQNSPEPAVMLMTLKTGGVGLNLTKASVVYHLEPWWNPAVENQATDRAHRMGQTKDVKVYNLLIEGSLEERISDLKLKKQGSFDRLFGVEEDLEESNTNSTMALSKEDFIYLLK